MNKKISLGITISLIAIGCAITFVLTWTISLGIFNEKIASSEKLVGVYAKLQAMNTVVRDNYIGTVNDENLETAMIEGYISGMNDPYAYYMPPSAYYELQQTTSGVIKGAGFDSESDGSGYLKITHIYKGSSAESNGVQIGDVITEIDGQSLLAMDTATAQERLSGEPGTKLSLKLVRNSEPLSVTLVRQQTDIESVIYEILAQDIGYIRITTFNDKTADQFSEALDLIITHNAKSVIIDVRQNGGGTVASLKPMLNRLIPAAVIAKAKYKNGMERTLIETDSDESLDIPIVVLVDGGTASTAELFAAALRDWQNARLIGTQTVGKAVMQNTYPFQDGSAFVFTTAAIEPTKSPSYNGIGLRPDYVVELPAGSNLNTISRENDSQFNRAIEFLAPEPVIPNPPSSSTSSESN